MKARNVILSGLLALSLSGCSYLNVDPELGITEEDVFSTFTGAYSFLNVVYDANNGKNKTTVNLCYPFYMDMLQSFYFAWVATTDAADCGRLGYAQRNFKQGFLSQDLIKPFTFSQATADKPVADAMFKMIRIANKSIANFGMLQNGTEKERNQLLGEAYFIRGIAHFNLCRYFGGMPYIDYVIGGDDEWDLPRESAHDTYVKAAADLYRSYELLKAAGLMRRNTADNLVPSTDEIKKPGGCLALAVRARALLYAASPLCNENGEEDWKSAAEACGEALKACLENGYELLPLASYTNNYYGTAMTNEVIWGYSYSAANNIQNFGGMLSYCQSKLSGIKGSSGTHPTQNFVDRFETADGYSLRTEEERAIAAAAGSYNEQNPYANRDPRLDLVIIHDGSPAHANASISSAGGCFNIYYDPSTGSYPTTNLNSTNMYYGIEWGTGDSNTQGASNTGYYCKRYWNGSFSGSHYHLDPCFRLGELYLSYAEAVNEAYGPDGSTESLSVTAAEAVNLIRARAGMPEVRAEYRTDRDIFREHIRNERCVELAYESNHYYFDIRRWMIAPQTMSETLYGMYVEKCLPSSEYPLGRKFVRKPIPSNRQCRWRDYMYYLPFPDDQANTMINFVNNPKWQ